MQGFAVFPGRQTPNPVPGCSGGREQPLDTGLVMGWQPACPPIPPSRARSQVAHSPFPKPPPLALAAAFPASLGVGVGMAGAGQGGQGGAAGAGAAPSQLKIWGAILVLLGEAG